MANLSEEPEKPQYVKDWEELKTMACRNSWWGAYTALKEDGPDPNVDYAKLLEEWRKDDGAKSDTRTD